MEKIITVVGSLNMDMVIEAPRFPEPGETIHGYGFFMNPGGKGANQAVAAAKLGGKVNMIGAVGDDQPGKELIRNLDRFGVCSSGVKTIQNCSSGIAVITIVKGENSIILDPGANNSAGPDLVKAYEQMIVQSSILIAQLETPLEGVTCALEMAGKQGIRTVLNPAPARALSDHVLKFVDILILNETELLQLTGLKPDDTYEQGIHILLDKGVQTIILTLGQDGVMFNQNAAIQKQPAFAVKAIDSTGAGDSFIGAFCVKMLETGDLEHSITFAQKVASITVSRKGAQCSFPGIDDPGLLPD